MRTASEEATPSATGGRFRDRVVVVTGGGSGIGFAAAERIAAEGGTVVLMGRDRDRLAAAAGRLDGHEVVTVAADVATDGPATLQGIVAEHGRLDALVNNAGSHRGPQAVDEITDDDWDVLQRTNMLGTLAMTRAAVPLMRAQGGGSIVCVSSISARGFHLSSNAAYAAAKAGVIGYVRVAVLQLGRDRIRVNAVVPGPTATEPYVAGVQKLAESEGISLEEAGARRGAMFGATLGRALEPSEVGSAIAFLASDDASGITGQSLNVDGGLLFD